MADVDVESQNIKVQTIRKLISPRTTAVQVSTSRAGRV